MTDYWESAIILGMKAKKWQEVDMLPSEWVVKLVEELGEIADVVSGNPKLEHEIAQLSLIAELSHLQFIAGEFRKRMEKKYSESRKATKSSSRK